MMNRQPSNPIPGSEWTDDSSPIRLSLFEVLHLLRKENVHAVELDDSHQDLAQSIYDDHEWEERQGYCGDDL